ncbi:MAG: transposase [Dehalococcoidia bacterium]|nr:transposase [Dehalococcoidia bacterium]
MNDPLAYLITFSCYGTWLHGDERGSFDRDNRTFGEPPVPVDAARRDWERRQLRKTPWYLDKRQRDLVERTIAEVCDRREWYLSAVNARTNHVHAVVSGVQSPEAMMTAFKAWSTRVLREHGLATSTDRVWSRHGSTVYLWTEKSVADAVYYVVWRQDEDRWDTEQ